MLFLRSPNSITVHAPAKLNLFLELLSRRDDGFHELETLMVSVALFDTLLFEQSSGSDLSLQIAGGTPAEVSSVPLDESNLILKAAQLLRSESGVERGARILLTKRIPTAAGLAGGSSDAAAALWALNQLWECRVEAGRLAELAARLGSDIAYFLGSRPMAVCRGRGEIVEPVNVPLGWHFVIAKPESGLSTAEVYRGCRVPELPASVDRFVDQIRRGHPATATQWMHNALQETAVRLNSDVDSVRRQFDRLPVLGHLMSGSGSAYFGVCAGLRQARQVAGRLRSLGVSRVFVARSLA